MYAEIKAAVDSVRVLSTILSASKDLRNFNELSAAVSEVNAKLVTAMGVALASQEKQAALSKRVRQLEEEVSQLKHWDTASKDDTLQEVGMGVFAYVSKPIVPTKQPRHWACAQCFEHRQRFLLQRWKGYAYTCPQCGAVIEASKDGQFVSIDDAYKASQGTSSPRQWLDPCSPNYGVQPTASSGG